MDVIRLGLALRALRHRRHLTQAAIGARAGMSRSAVARIERGGADRVTVRALAALAATLGARVDVRVMWGGEALDRLLDARHAALVDAVVRLLADLGWEARSEVTFQVRGERGSVDVLALHRATGSLAVIEVKSTVPDLQAMLGALDRRSRLAREIAAGCGWRPSSVSRILVLPDDRTARRRVETHAATFRVALPARTVAVRRWLRRPDGTLDGILFLSGVPQAGTRHRVASPRPVRRPSAPPQGRHSGSTRPGAPASTSSRDTRRQTPG